jgi:hypothetical protein
MVDWLKQITSPATTTASIFAGDVLNWVIQYHDDIDLAAGDPAGVVHILTETVFNSGRLKWYDSNKSHTVSINVPDYVEDKSLNLPSTLGPTDEIVFEDAAQVLTNKTLSVNLNILKHSTTNAAGDLLKGDGASFVRFPRGSNGQVLTSSGTDLTWVTPSVGGNVSTTQTNIFGDFDQVFRSGRLDITNPANTFNYSFVGGPIVAARIITLPFLSADDTMVTAAFSQVLSNKTVDVDSNTIKHSTTNVAGDILKGNGTSFQRLGRGTTGQVLTSSASDVLWQTPSTNQLYFLPDVANTGIHWGLWTGGARDGTGAWSGTQTFGTATAKQDSTTGTKITTDFVTGSIAGNTAGFQGFQPTTVGFYTARNQNFHFKAKFQVDVLTNRRFAIGLASVGSLPAGVDAYLATAVPGFLFRFSDTTDTTIKLLRNDNAGTAVTVDTGLTLAVNTPVTLDIYADEANTRMGWAINGGTITYYTTDIPAATTGLNYFLILETKSAAAQKLQLYYSYLVQDVVS